MCLPAFVSLVLLALKLHPGYAASPCLSSSEILTWNRHLYFDKKPFTLKLAATDDPVHQLVNHIFAILARERLGYQNVEFVHLEEDDDIARTIDGLKPSDKSHTSLPNVHLNLLLWLPSGIDINHWAPPSTITDHGPLGPTRQWELRSQSEFSGSSRSKKNTWSFKFENSCSENPSAYFERISALIDREVHSNDSSFTGQPVTVYEWTVEGSNIKSNTYKWIDPPLCGTLSSITPGNGVETIPTVRDSEDKLCRTESYQAVKISWANLSSISPPIHKLASRIYLADYDFEELRRKVARLRVGSSALEGFFHESACSWLRRNPSKWVSWTEGWNQKLNLTVAWMSDSIYFGLKQVAEQAIALLNGAASYFRDTEYAFTLHAHHCQDGMALNEYFKILAGSAENRLIGTIAAIPSDRMESVVELSNLRKKLILSPTLATAQFLERRRYPYFFRTIPAMTQANYILLRLFLKWNWRRLVILRKRDHFFNARLFQAKNIEIIDMQLEEQQLTYKKARHSLENLKKLNSRIFVVEYEAVGTYRVLCAAYHLGMHFDAGYVWFLNPWLSDGWWQHESLSGIKECTHQQIANISSFTFSVGHQWMIPDLYFSEDELTVSPPSSSSSTNHSADRGDLVFHNKTSSLLNVGNTKRQHPGATKQRPKRQAVGDRSRISAALRNSSHSYNLFDDSNQSKWYQAYTTDAVIALGVAVVNLLKSNPWALFELDRPQIAETLRDLVSQTNSAPFGLFKTYFISSLFRSPLGLHFNSLNERVASHWVVKQTRGNTTVPVFWWSVIQKQSQPLVSAAHHNQSTSQTIDSKANSTVDGEVSDQNKTNVEIQDLLDAFASFERHTSMNIADKVDWSRNGGPPPDGSQVADTCAFPFLSNTLRMGCTGATVFVAVSITLVCLIPVILASLHYRRKLREAERLTRKPFEELCEELADLNIPMEAVVLNRHIGQGAFGLVFGGEVKTNGTWEAVAVKVLNEKATYEGKIDFLSEAKLMRSLEHRNVVRLIGISLNLKNTIYLIMELMLLGDLKTYLLSRRILAQRSPDHEDIRPSTLTNMSIDIAQGVQYLHSKNLIHRDIACRNCLVASDHVVKIGDFGLTRERTTNRPDGYYRFTRNCELPIRWMSPEAVQYGMFSVQSDIWSYGITLYEIVTFGVFPYSDMCDVEVVERIKRMEFSISDFLPASARNTVVWNLIRLCCQHQFGDRPSSMDQVLQVLYDYPECVRPFLTDEPPKPTLVTDQTPLVQPVLDGTTVRAPPISGYSVNDSCVSDMGLGAGFCNLRCSSATDFHPLQSSLSLQFGDQLEENAQRVVDTGVRYYYPRRNRLSHSSLHNLGGGGAGDCLKACSNHSVVVSSACIGEHNHANLSGSASSESSSSSQCPGFFLPPSVPQSPQQEAHKPLLLTSTVNSFRERTDAKMCSNNRRRSPSLSQSPALEDRAESLKLLNRDGTPNVAKSTELNVYRRLCGVPQRSLSVTNVHELVRSEVQTPEFTTDEDLTFYSVGTSIFSPVSPSLIRADCSCPFPAKRASGDTHDSCGLDPLYCHSFEHPP